MSQEPTPVKRMSGLLDLVEHLLVLPAYMIVGGIGCGVIFCCGLVFVLMLLGTGVE